jgi:hypothetical protein
MKTILTNVFTEAQLFPVIDSVYNRIKEAYDLDPYLGMGGNSLNAEVDVLKSFITQRRNYLLTNLPRFSR